MLELESEGDNLFAKPGDVVFVGAADLLDQAVKPEAPEQPRDLAAGFLFQPPAQVFVLETADVELADAERAE